MPFRHPVMTARLAADLDNLSQGRLILGMGIGWDANEFTHAYIDAGIQYFVVETLDAADTDTIRLLAEEVIPHVVRLEGPGL